MHDQIAASSSNHQVNGEGAHTTTEPFAPLDYWYIVCRSRDLSESPISRELLGKKLVLFRDAAGKPGALLDRCAHRAIPLSKGRTRNGFVECAYHGWRYDTSGFCRFVPALGKAPASHSLVPSYVAAECQGYVWVFGRSGANPDTVPFRIPEFADKRYATVASDFEAEASLFDMLENQVDVPHTSVVHAGLFRSKKRRRVPVEVRRFADRVETEYQEPRPPGLVGRLMVPGKSNGIVHIDRFILPSIIQVEYRVGSRAHILITNILTPIAQYRTSFWSVVRFHAPLGKVFSAVFGRIAGKRFIEEDTGILKLQTDTRRQAGEAPYFSTEADVMGPHIADLLHRAKRGRLVSEEVCALKASTPLSLLL